MLSGNMPPAVLMAKQRRAYIDLILGRLAELGVQKTELQGLAEMGKSTLDQWLSGETENPPLTGIVRLCEILGISGDEIFASVIEEERASNPDYPLAGPLAGKLERARLKLEVRRAERELLLLHGEAEERQLRGELDDRLDPEAGPDSEQ